jgi:hypothetical protein
MIQKEFVPYDIALALKELGFDEPCMASRDMDNGEGLIQLPLYQQAFRWFRENNMHSYIDFADGKWSFIIFDTKLPVYYYPIQDQDTDTNDNVEYDTYEEAEIACLKKLIEIVKDGRKSN